MPLGAAASSERRRWRSAAPAGAAAVRRPARGEGLHRRRRAWRRPPAGLLGCRPSATRSATVVERLEAAGTLLLGARPTCDRQLSTGPVGTRSPFGAPSSTWSEAHVSGGSRPARRSSLHARSSPSRSGPTRPAPDAFPPPSTGSSATSRRAACSAPPASSPPAARRSTVALEFAVAPTVAMTRATSRRWRDGAGPALEPLLALADADARPPGRRCRQRCPPLAPRLAVPTADGARAAAGSAGRRDVRERRRRSGPAMAGTTLVEVDVAPLLEAGTLLYEDRGWPSATGPSRASCGGGGRGAGDLLAGAGAAAERDPLAGDHGSTWPCARSSPAGARFSAADAFAAQTRLAALAARRRCSRCGRPPTRCCCRPPPRHPTHAAVAADPIAVNAAVGRLHDLRQPARLPRRAVPVGRAPGRAAVRRPAARAGARRPAAARPRRRTGRPGSAGPAASVETQRRRLRRAHERDAGSPTSRASTRRAARAGGADGLSLPPRTRCQRCWPARPGLVRADGRRRRGDRGRGVAAAARRRSASCSSERARCRWRSGRSSWPAARRCRASSARSTPSPRPAT